MHLTRQLIVLAALLTAGLGPSTPGAAAPGEPTVQQLFSQLQSRRTSDQATTELLKLGNTSASARRFLVIHLPALIQADARDLRPDATGLLRPEWCNAARLAGGLKLVEAAPALARSISLRTSGGLRTATRAEGLTDSPAGTALVQIGDAAIPALRRVLEPGSSVRQADVVYALLLINSPSARVVLGNFAARAAPEEREFIYNRLATWASHDLP
jgi:hypothetical protein